MNFRKAAAAVLGAALAIVSAFAEDAIAAVDFLDGPVSLSREGVPLKSLSIGDDLFDGDRIVTGAGGSLVIALDKSTGMSGTIKVSQRTTLYLELSAVKGERQTQAELIAGQLAVKVKRLSGSPGLSVATEGAVAAVRGTEFGVTLSDSGSALVDCSEGEVLCSDESGQESALPGQAVEKREGERLARRAVALADYKAFKEKWLADESAAFKRNAPRAARLIALRYNELETRLAALHEELLKSGALRRWGEERAAKRPSQVPEGQLKAELAELGPKLAEARRLLGSMERIDARVEELEGFVGDDESILAEKVRPRFTVGDFFKRFDAEKERNAKRTAWLRLASRMYRLRSAQLEGRGASK